MFQPYKVSSDVQTGWVYHIIINTKTHLTLFNLGFLGAAED